MVLKHHQSIRLLVYGFLGAICMCASYLIFRHDPIGQFIEFHLNLENSTIAFWLWKRPPLEVYLRVFAFNYTNMDRFISGEDATLKVEELGPFVYQEYLENQNARFLDNGTLYFEPQRQVVFRPERSVGNPEDLIVTVPNVALLGISSALHESSMFLNLAVSQLATYLDTKAMLNLTLQQYLWGYDDPLVKLASNVLPSWIHFPRLGLLDRLFDEGFNRVTINVDKSVNPSKNEILTEKERALPYGIREWNESPGFAQWGYTNVGANETSPSNTKCNLLEGAYDGTIFPRNLDPTMQLRVYRKAFCRTLAINVNRTGKTHDGYDALFYKMAKNSFEYNEDNKCYCRKGPNCLPKGLSDLTPCYYGITMAVSQPHFLNGDPALFERIEGLNPNEEEHDTTIAIHPTVGVPLFAQSRVQTNLVVRSTKYNSRTKPFNDIIMPLFWMELLIERVPTIMRVLLVAVSIAPYVQIAIIATLAVGGFALFVYSVIRVFITSDKYEQNIEGKLSEFASLHIDYSPVKVIPVKSYEFIDRESIC